MESVIIKERLENLQIDSDKRDIFLQTKNNKEVIYLLNKLGKLPDNFDENILLYFLKNDHPTIRYLAVKNLGKLNRSSLLPTFKKLVLNDNNSNVRKEATSAIGRMRNIQAIPFLIKLLKDSDPEVVLQAVRALIVFKARRNILSELKRMKAHPNEIIQDVIKTELFQTKEIQEKGRHAQFPEKLKNRVVLGDIEDIIKSIPDRSVHLTFTSPPYYNARDYSIYRSYKGYLKFLTKVFREVFRVTKEGRFFVLNTSPIIIPRAGRKYSSKRYPIPYDIHCFLMEMGWEFIDDIIWLKPEASAKNRNAGFGQHRKPLAYKPNTRTEMVMVYRKKTNKLIDWNIKQYSESVIEESKIKNQYETSNVWKIDPSFDKVHSAIFPLELCDRVIKLYSFINDLVFDPFAGSGTVGKSAVNLNRNFFLTEKKAEYFERIQENIGFLIGHYSTLKEFEKMS